MFFAKRIVATKQKVAIKAMISNYLSMLVYVVI